MLLDTFAWIEFFRGTEKGSRVKNFLSEKICFTSAISLAELSEWVERERLNRDFIFRSVRNLSTIIDLDSDILEYSGVLKVEKRKTVKDIGLIDAIILSTARHYNLPVLTGDPHFIGENTVFL